MQASVYRFIPGKTMRASIMDFPVLSSSTEAGKEASKTVLRKSIEERTNHNARMGLQPIRNVEQIMIFPIRKLSTPVLTSSYSKLQSAMYSHHHRDNAQSCTTQHSLHLGTFFAFFFLIWNRLTPASTATPAQALPHAVVVRACILPGYKVVSYPT